MSRLLIVILSLGNIFCLGLFLQGCIALPVDGGSIVISHCEAYWEKEDFPLHVLVDVNMPAKYIEASLVATEAWNRRIGAPVLRTLVVSPDNYAARDYGIVTISLSVHSMGSRSGRSVLGLAGAVVHQGTSHMQASIITLKEDLKESVLLVVLAHELGHALTLEHDNDCGSLMHPFIIDCGGVPRIRDNDVRRIQDMVSGASRASQGVGIQFLPSGWGTRCHP